MSVSDFLSDFADVDVDRAVADDHAVAPDAGVDLFPGEEFSGRGGEQGEQGELSLLDWASMSITWYLIEELPQLSTKMTISVVL